LEYNSEEMIAYLGIAVKEDMTGTILRTHFEAID
jgi:hypothetical protein